MLERSPKNIEAISKTIKEYTTIVDSFINSELELAKQGKKVSPPQKIANDFLMKTYLNVEAIVPLLELYKSRRGTIQPIGLILRSVFSDFLTLVYLLTFPDHEGKSFENELHLFEKDSLKSFLEVMELEKNVHEFLKVKPEGLLTSDQINEKINKLKTQIFPHLFRKDLSFKTTAELRSTSNNDLFKTKNQFLQPNGFVTEKYKWERIQSDDNLKKYILIFFGYKVFSQFQHYSQLSMGLLDRNSEGIMFYYLIVGLDSLFISTDFQFQIIGGTENKYLTELRKLQQRLDSEFE